MPSATAHPHEAPGTGLSPSDAAYLYVLPFDSLRTSPLVASDTMVRVLGAAGAVAAMVMVSTFGALDGTILVNPRCSLPWPPKGCSLGPSPGCTPGFGTPHVAIIVFALLSRSSAFRYT